MTRSIDRESLREDQLHRNNARGSRGYIRTIWQNSRSLEQLLLWCAAGIRGSSQPTLMLQHYPHLQAGKEKKSGSRTNPSHQSCWPAKTQAKLNSLRLFCIMVSFTAQNTRRMFSVSYPARMQREQNGEGERKTGKRNRHMDKQRCQYTKEPRGTKQSVTATHSAKSRLRR